GRRPDSRGEPASGSYRGRLTVASGFGLQSALKICRLAGQTWNPYFVFGSSTHLAGRSREVMMKGKWKFGLVLLAISLIASASSASDIKAAAGAAMSKYQKAVITVRVVAKVKSPRGEEENQFEVIGSVIDPSGLTVVSAQSIDPAAMVRALLATMGRQGQDAMAKFDSDITQTTMILQDGTEVDADVVLKDADLDLAFVRPRKTQTFDSISLKPRGKPLEALEDIFVIDRLERSENRVTAINIGMIQAVVKG